MVGKHVWTGLLKATLAVLIVTWGSTFKADAGSTHDFNQDVAQAFANYRGALFYFRRKNGDPGAFELDLFKDAWLAIEKKWKDNPPDSFSSDPQWVATFGEVTNIVDRGFDALDKNGPEAARKTLRPIRDLLSALRRRNGVYVFSDCIDELNMQMKKIWPYRHNPPDFNDLAQVNKVKHKAAVYEYILLKCRKDAPADYKKRDEFNRMFDAAQKSVQTLWDATDKKQRRRFINILRELRPLDRLIFLRFG